MWKKALARFLLFQPGHIRRSESPRASGLGARRQPAQHRALRMKTERPGSQQQEGEGRRFNSFSPSWKTNQKDGGRGGGLGVKKSKQQISKWAIKLSEELKTGNRFLRDVSPEFSRIACLCCAGRLQLLHSWVFCQHWLSLALLTSGSKKHHRVISCCRP